MFSPLYTDALRRVTDPVERSRSGVVTSMGLLNKGNAKGAKMSTKFKAWVGFGLFAAIHKDRGLFFAVVPKHQLPARFAPPWSIEDIDGAFVVKDSSGQKLLFVWYEDETGRRSSGQAAHSRRARRIAANVAKLPDLLRK
jgi:hypothetical protein